MSDDLIYALAMFVSVAAGPLFRTSIKTPKMKKWISSGIGLILLSGVCGYHILHIFITVGGNCVLVFLYPPFKGERLGQKSFIWNFGYLVIFRTLHWFGIPSPSPITNAAQLFLVLRMVGLAFELQDSHERKKKMKEQELVPLEKQKLILEQKYGSIDISLLDICLYSFCYIGLLTGPYYKYRTYEDWLHLSNDVKLNSKRSLLDRIYKIPLIIATFLTVSHFFSIQYVQTDEFLTHSFTYRLFYMVPMFTIFRTRLYLAWIMSECMSISAGLGAYPTKSKPKCGNGPTDFHELDQVLTDQRKNPTLDAEWDFETIHNIDIYGCELAPRTKQGLRSWNMTVQYWLANHVHHRVPSFLKAYRVAITMGVSAFWHGIHPGYYLSFLTVPPILMAEDAMIKAFRNDASPGGQVIFDWSCWFFKMRGFDYNCMGFLLLGFDSTIRYWSSIYFMGHIVTAFFFLLGRFCIFMKSKEVLRKTQ